VALAPDLRARQRLCWKYERGGAGVGNRIIQDGGVDSGGARRGGDAIPG
jgi:hypothetical protein